MDANRFDEFTKALGLSAARRGILAGLLGGSVASVLASLETAARRHTGPAYRDNDLSAEKRKKKKCKKCGPCRSCKKGKCKPKTDGTPCSGGSCQSGACKQGDEPPPCTDESCTLPPECSQQDFDECAAELVEALHADIEPCRSDCEGGDSPACRACLEPILTAHLLEAQACVAESCSLPVPSSAAPRHRAKVQAGPTDAHERWQRRCNKPTCCTQDLETCYEDANGDFLKCMAPAVATGCFLGGPAGCAAGMILCLANFAYDQAACEGRYGCPSGQYCIEGDICCPYGTRGCGTQCCSPGTTCCHGVCCGSTSQCWSCGSESRCCPEITKVCCNGTCCSSDNAKCCGTRSACYGKEVDCSTVGG